ncbi:MAG: hypothetical protein AB1941_02910 [Gemmatimonadota bacterium]
MNGPSPIEQFFDRWRAQASNAENELQLPQVAALIRRLLAELEEAIKAEIDRPLTSAQAETFSNVHRDTLRRTVENRGEPYRPAYRAGDLPVKRGAPSISRLTRILQLMTEKAAGSDDARREQIRQQARDTARRSRIA